ncbi:MAG: alpha/beta hydrolase [Actinomycetes bacterium]
MRRPENDKRLGIDPILLKVLEAVPFRLSLDDGVQVARQQLRDLPRRPVHPQLRVEDRTVPGPTGAIPVRIYWPPDAGDDAPVVVFFHGGGFVVGDLDTHDGTCRQHAVGAGAVVVSVDYRLAPEYPYPAAVDDALATTQWVAEHASEIGADTTRLAVAGDSAVAAFSRWYAGDVDLSNPPAGMAPGRAENLAGLAPAYIAVAGHDPLRDDGIRYGELLAAAGVAVEVHNAETLVHGYVGYAGVVPAAIEAMDRALTALKSGLHQPIRTVGP